jgi:alpha-L-fucosidase
MRALISIVLSGCALLGTSMNLSAATDPSAAASSAIGAASSSAGAVVGAAPTTLPTTALPTTAPFTAADLKSLIPVETKQQRDARMAWWREEKFGMFIHWGVYSVPGGVWKGKPIWGGGEWIMNCGQIPVADYQQLPHQFNPVKFDADKWVSIAKAAGMKYIVITSKHHDGFAMFKSEASPFNIVDDTPFKRDVLKELSEACAKQGMHLGFYYSQAQDWNHPGGVAIKVNGRKTEHWDPAQDGDFDNYLRTIAVPQVKEILTHYGKVSVLWFDTGIDMTPARAALFLPLLKLQPGLIVNNRLGGGFPGDTKTPEQNIPPKGYPGEDWETCMTMNGTWGFKSTDDNWKPTSTLIRNLIDIASKGGNYLLNVGPTSLGEIPQPSVDRLAEVGKWLAVNGEAIYGASPTAFGAEDGSFDPTKLDKKGKPVFNAKWDWRCTTKPAPAGSGEAGKIYIHFLKWPGTAFDLDGVKDTITSATLLADPTHPLTFSQDGEKLHVTLPADAPDPIASVMRLETKPATN